MLRKLLARHAKQPTFPSALSMHYRVQSPSFAGAMTLDFAGCQIKEMFLAVRAPEACDAILPA